jgi:hypothetical protein
LEGTPNLLNDLIGAGEQSGRHFQAEGFGILQLELGRLLTERSPGFSP